MKRLEITKDISAPLATVWATITNHEGMVDWSPLKRVVLDSEGTPDRNGLGAVRRMMGAGPTIVEEVTDWDAPNQYTYILRKGAPIRDHCGTVQLSRNGDETRVLWSIEFRPIVPGTGWLMAGILRKVIGGMLERLKHQLQEPGSS